MKNICERLGIIGLDKKLLINYNENEVESFSIETEKQVEVNKCFDVFEISRTLKTHRNEVFGINEDGGLETIVVVEKEEDSNLNLFTFYGVHAKEYGKKFKKFIS